MIHNADGSFSFPSDGEVKAKIDELHPKGDWSPKYHTWEEDGQKYFCWEISKGIYTGDAGHREFCRILAETVTKGL